MGAKFNAKTTKDDFSKMIKSAQAISGKKVNVGVLQGEHQWLARIHEYGCKITVTPKMRAYLHRQGLHLKASTTVITIPERSFLRSGFDQHHKEVVDKAERTLPDVLLGTMSEDEYCKLVGTLLASKIKDYATDLNKPANHPFTVEQKGSANPLVDTGEMVRGITFEVEE